MNNIRNFCIISHIDHGKSTLSKKLINYYNNINCLSKIIDSINIENEKGVTIKSKNVCFEYIYNNKKYILNLIDTPGHMDFCNEVYKYIISCEGVLLLIDSTKGIEAQTLSIYNYIKTKNITIIIIITKIDSKNSNINKTLNEIKNILNINENIILCSAKKNYGIKKILNNIIKLIPCPKGNINNNLKIIIINF
ncbi:GTP-binding protein [Candidatus Nardonella dryophthoridicola]|uniref:GTP-binding protein n=1 Tax=endosymbiont of Metamasius hemipterus TaxID=204627 RepID=A0ABT0TWB9_9GAMM|nr:GTP-binding protein [Candidatus Nardonella dryophthoridicola]MCM0158291.1 GTP-binding protein [endosymbiont of Metamasius hemipterus]